MDEEKRRLWGGPGLYNHEDMVTGEKLEALGISQEFLSADSVQDIPTELAKFSLDLSIAEIAAKLGISQELLLTAEQYSSAVHLAQITKEAQDESLRTYQASVQASVNKWLTANFQLEFNAAAVQEGVESYLEDLKTRKQISGFNVPPMGKFTHGKAVKGIRRSKHYAIAYYSNGSTKVSSPKAMSWRQAKKKLAHWIWCKAETILVNLAIQPIQPVEYIQVDLHVEKTDASNNASSSTSAN